MEFEWDEVKRRANLAKHGIDFRAARSIFDGRPYYEYPSRYPDEPRLERTGLLNNDFVTVIWTQRDQKVRIISARIARHAERRAYRDLHDG